MKILIVEDTAFMAQAFKVALSKIGHDVTVVPGFQTLEPDKGVSPDGTEVLLNQFDAALVDGQLEGSYDGIAVVDTLAQLGVKCIGISSQRDFNERMEQKGAVLGVQKVVALGAVYTGLLNPQTVRREQQPALEQLAVEIRHNEVLRRQLDQLVMPYMR